MCAKSVEPEAEPHRSPEAQTSSAERFRNIALGLAGVISSVLIPLLGLYYTSRDKEREVSKGFVGYLQPFQRARQSAAVPVLLQFIYTIITKGCTDRFNFC